jgi:hypothetical protein
MTKMPMTQKILFEKYTKFREFTNQRFGKKDRPFTVT